MYQKCLNTFPFMNSLPIELLLEICHYLNGIIFNLLVSDVVSLSAVDSRLRSQMTHCLIWKSLKDELIQVLYY
jgi:hypothetical protein